MTVNSPSSIVHHCQLLIPCSIVVNCQLSAVHYQLPITNYQLPITNYRLPITNINMRSIFLLVIVVGLTIFALQNIEPALSLVFLGVRSPALPLSIWVLSSIAAGVVTSLVISSLLSFSNYLSQSRSSRRVPPEAVSETRRTPYTPPAPPRKQEIDPDRNWENRETQSASGYQTQYGTPAGYDSRTVYQESPPVNPPNVKQPIEPIEHDDEDDWVSDSSKKRYPYSDEDWGEERENPSRPTVNDATAANPKDYEAKQEPKSKSWAGSVYSFGYRDPSKSGVGQTESVYDAEYRVLVPPMGEVPQTDKQEIPNSNSDDDEDWGLDDDDDVLDGDEPNSKQQPDR
ncbi:MAG: LapA family protein [Microcoleus sp.]